MGELLLKGADAIAKAIGESRNSISGLISRWAPANENDTAAYVNAVARACGVEPFQVINVADYLPSMVRAIIIRENGQQPYTDEQISQAIAMATGGDMDRGSARQGLPGRGVCWGR